MTTLFKSLALWTMILFFSLLTHGLHAQVVPFEDEQFAEHMSTAKKFVNGIWEFIHSNGDGLIQISEAEDCENIIVKASNYSIGPGTIGVMHWDDSRSIKGIEYFINLKQLKILSPINVGATDFRTLTKLEILELDMVVPNRSEGHFAIDVSGLKNLKEIKDNETVCALRISGCDALENFDVDGTARDVIGDNCNTSDSLDFRNMPNLKNMYLRSTGTNHIIFEDNNELSRIEFGWACFKELSIKSLEKLDQFTIGP